MPKNKNTKAKIATEPAKKATPKPAAKKKLSALDAASQVLLENSGSMNTKELVEAMARKKLWQSPNGKTPAATLYAALLREINTKGADSRFKKTQPGQFAATGAGEVRARAPKALKGAKKKPTGKKGVEPAAETIADGTTGTQSGPEVSRT